MLYGPWPRSGRLLRHFCFSSSFLRVPNPGGARPCQGGTHCVQWGGRWRPALTWPRRDYIALLEEEEKAPQQPAAACGCQGPATAMVPAATAGGQGRGARPRPRCPAAHSPAVKDRSTYSGAQRPARGGGARCPRAARQPTPALPGTRVRLQERGQSAARPHEGDGG